MTSKSFLLFFFFPRLKWYWLREKLIVFFFSFQSTLKCKLNHFVKTFRRSICSNPLFPISMERLWEKAILDMRDVEIPSIPETIREITTWRKKKLERMKHRKKKVNMRKNPLRSPSILFRFFNVCFNLCPNYLSYTMQGIILTRSEINIWMRKLQKLTGVYHERQLQYLSWCWCCRCAFSRKRSTVGRRSCWSWSFATTSFSHLFNRPQVFFSIFCVCENLCFFFDLHMALCDESFALDILYSHIKRSVTRQWKGIAIFDSGFWHVEICLREVYFRSSTAIWSFCGIIPEENARENSLATRIVNIWYFFF